MRNLKDRLDHSYDIRSTDPSVIKLIENSYGV